MYKNIINFLTFDQQIKSKKKGKYEILVADNSELSVRIIKEILDGIPDDIELYSAKDGKTACEIASELIPDLILMDGGKGQVNIAEKVLQEIGLQIDVCGMVKDEKHRTRGLYYRNPRKKL